MNDTEKDECGVGPLTFRGWLKSACEFHDKAYIKDSWHQKNMTRRELDELFLRHMLTISNNSFLRKTTSYVMYGVVRMFGGFWWEGKL